MKGFLPEKVAAQMSTALDKTKKVTIKVLEKTKDEAKKAYDEIHRGVEEQRAIMNEKEKKSKNKMSRQRKVSKKMRRESSGMFIQSSPSIRNIDSGAKNEFFCTGCQNKRPGPTKGYVNVLELKYHIECLKCASCYALIDLNKDQLSYIVDEKTGKPQPVHVGCYGNMLGIKCIICNNNIPTDKKTGQVEFVTPHPYFDEEKMCPFHTNLRRCTSCSRYESQSHPFKSLDDGKRFICQACDRTRIKNATDDVASLWDKIIHFFENELNLSISDEMKDMKIKIVNQAKLKEQSIKCGIQQPSDEGMARGLCITEAIPNPDAKSISDLNWKVSCILCINGLPRDLTAQVLAHEATHAYIKLHPKYDMAKPPIPLQVEEGVCQLMSFLFLKDGLKKIKKQDETKSEANSNDNDPSDKELRKYFKYAIKHDPDKVYGDGFRMAYSVYNQVGSVKKILSHIVKNRCFPPTEK